MPVGNLLEGVQWRRKARQRERRVEGDRGVRLFEGASKSRAPCLQPCIILAIEIGMPSSEIAHLHWGRIGIARYVIRRDLTKNKEPRTVPLPGRAEATIRASPQQTSGPLITFYDSDDLWKAFVRARKRAGITGPHPYDLGREAASRLDGNPREGSRLENAADGHEILQPARQETDRGSTSALTRQGRARAAGQPRHWPIAREAFPVPPTGRLTRISHSATDLSEDSEFEELRI